MLCIAFVLGTVPTVAWADDPPAYEPVYMPKCDVYTLKSGAEICGFEAAVWFGKVLTVDAELVHAKAQLKNESARSAELAKQVEILQGQIDVHGDTRKLLVEREAKLTKDMIDLDRKYQLERVKPRWGNPVAWGIAAVSVALLGGYVVNDALN